MEDDQQAHILYSDPAYSQFQASGLSASVNAAGAQAAVATGRYSYC